MADAVGVPVMVAAVPKTKLLEPSESKPLVSFKVPFMVTGVFILTPLLLAISIVEFVLVVIGPAPEIDWALVPFIVTVPAEAGEKFRIPPAATTMFPRI